MAGTSNFTRTTKIDSEELAIADISEIDEISDMPPLEHNKYNIKVLQEAENFTVILSLYILPMLYGLLGGFAYVLRNLWEETRKMVYSKESNVKFALRIHLGALAGLVVGLFWGDMQTKQLNFTENLSPLALAFIAGYSVEFLFKIIDKIISSIDKVNENETPQTKTT